MQQSVEYNIPTVFGWLPNMAEANKNGPKLSFFTFQGTQQTPDQLKNVLQLRMVEKHQAKPNETIPINKHWADFNTHKKIHPRKLVNVP